DHAPLDVWQRNPPEHLPSARPEAAGGKFFLRADRFEDRNQFPGNKRKCHERRRQHETGGRENHLIAVFTQPGAEIALGPEEQQGGRRGTKRPWAQKRTTKTNPARTGETEKEKSIGVRRRAPRENKTRKSPPAAAPPNTRLNPTATGATVIVSKIECRVSPSP